MVLSVIVEEGIVMLLWELTAIVAREPLAILRQSEYRPFFRLLAHWRLGLGLELGLVLSDYRTMASNLGKSRIVVGA